MYVNEDMLTKWVKSKGGLLITRSELNIQNFDFKNNTSNLCILTGYKKHTELFFTDLINRFTNKVILIIIESDIIHLQGSWLDNDKLIHCFTWNKPFEHKKLSCIPIGLNFRRHYKSLITFIHNNNINEKIIHSSKNLVCFNCSLNTSPERKVLKNIIDTKLNSFCTKLDYIKPITSLIIPSFIEGKIRVDITDPKCYNDWINYKFILSPEGTGFDCHRTWEALMIGCIPIVKKSSINELYKDLPIVIVNDWEELNVEFLEKKYIEICENKKQNKYNYDKLYLHFWCTQIMNKLNIKPITKPLLLNKNNIHFITYGDDKYKSSRIRLTNQAKDFGIFHSIQGYDKNMINEKFKDKYNEVLNMSRGGGYWIWKIDIFKQILDTIDENDFLVYLDAGCHLNKNGLQRFYEYINMFNNTTYGILSFQMSDQSEKYWTTSQIFKYFNVDDTDTEITNTGQYVGGVLIMKKNDHLREYIRLFEECIETDKYLITDKYNKINQKNCFKDNRHDQSISSVIRKQIGSIVVKGDESWKPPFGRGESLKYPFWAARSKQ